MLEEKLILIMQMELTSKIMKSKIRFIVAVFCVYATSIASGQESYGLIIRQIFPEKGVVYADAYYMRVELDSDVNKQKVIYSKKNCNYLFEITTPKGTKQEFISNIQWISVENGKATFLQSKPKIPEYFSRKTSWEAYHCNAYGKKVGENVKIEYDSYWRYYNGDSVYGDGKYRTRKLAKVSADAFYNKKLKMTPDSVLFKVEVYVAGEESPIAVYSSEERYNLFKANQEYMARVRAEEEKARQDSIAKTYTVAYQLEHLAPSISLYDQISQCRHIVETNVNQTLSEKDKEVLEKKLQEIIEKIDKKKARKLLKELDIDATEIKTAELENIKKRIAVIEVAVMIQVAE